MTHTTERVREAPSFVPPSPPPAPQPPRRSLEAQLIWGMIAAGLVAAVALLLMSITSGTGQPTPTDRPPLTQAVPGVPMSADAAERYLAQRHFAERGLAGPAGVPGSADAAERYLADRD